MTARFCSVESGAEATAVQTLARYSGALVIAERLDCAGSPALSDGHGFRSGRGQPQSKTLARGANALGAVQHGLFQS